ncbi:NADH pyrophosphatase [Candidatus Rhodobacter oscarellae]|uniref:NAD(+) diphosphatase n=1 Tax=Candidatus Rhodobacter oscarellae TaxID=1675527 RepID=A0A0J9E7F4_9RHOB|nr:NAD(+) diphosphatase [Candidatus Rhodobacter lobularis]KMW58695.1 NADH pyrophosphatase [Candidatus Rhodobacter lobularis]
MKIAEEVTFGGSGLDRAAELRDKPEAISRLLADPQARGLVFWRGKPLLAGEDRDAAGLVKTDHPVLQGAAAPLFLGLDEAGARFAYDISHWEPEALPDTMGQFFDPSEVAHPALGPGYVFHELRGVMTRLSARDAELIVTAQALFNWHRTHKFCARCGSRSEITNAGWQRNCSACNAPHFPRTDPVVIMLITRGNKVLMGRSPGWPEEMYSLLAGFVEPGETIEAAVRREVFEEAGVRVGAVEYLSSQPWPYPNSLMFGCWGEATSDEITIDPNEIEDAKWVTREQMMDVFAGNSDAMKPARKGAIAHFLIWNWLRDALD